MKKKLFSLVLAAAVCLGLTVSAFAADAGEEEPPFPVEEATKNIQVLVDSTGLEPKNFLVDYAYTLVSAEYDDDYNEIPVESEMTSYVAVSKNSTCTVKHVGTADSGSTIRIYVYVYSKTDDGKYEWVDWPHGFYLTHKAGFITDVEDPDVDEYGGLVELKAGESTTFTLPFEEFREYAGDDLILSLQPTIYYPEEDWSFYRYSFCKVDEAAYSAAAKGSAAQQPAAPAGGTSGFTDVAASAYYAEPVKWAVEKNITSGTSKTTFSPTNTCTNAQILTFLWRASGQPEPAIANPFTNSIQDAYAKAAVWAYEKGMVPGTAFEADKPCTRAMAVTYLWQAAGSPAVSSTAGFMDVPASAPYAQAVAWAVEKGVTTGTSTTAFSPDDICSRGQIVTFLYRAQA